jgi:RHS repeat-associated protein
VNIITDTDINNLRCQSDEYEPWGSVSKEEGNCDPTHRFTGKELDPETGIYYYGGRYYDQEIGRFISPDPFVPSPDDPQNLNRYSYALNNPQRYTDPTGYEGEASNNYFLYGALVWQAYKFFSDLFSSHDKPRIVRPSKAAPNNQRRGDIKNDGRKELENVSVYDTQGSGGGETGGGSGGAGNDYPGEGFGGPVFVQLVGADRPAKNPACTSALHVARQNYQAVARANSSWNILSAAASPNSIDPGLLAAIGVRETGFRNVNEWDGAGVGVGVFQITVSPTSGVTAAQASNLPWAARYAANMLASNRTYLRNRFPNFTPDQLLQATAASYNMNPYKPGNFTGNPATIDVGTAHGNYGSNVLNLMKCF